MEKFSSVLRITSIHAKLFSLVFALCRGDKNILIVSASAIRMSADRIRKPMDTIRMQTSRVRVFLNEKEERSGPFVLLSGALEEFFGRIGQTACSTKEKNRQKAEKYAFLGEK